MLYPLSYRGGVPDGETRSYGRAVRPPMGTARRLLVSRRRGSLRARCTRQRHAPPGAPDSTLTLVRYTIPVGAKRAPPVHPGVQMASIEAGTLTYTVMSGTAQVRRAGASIDMPHHWSHGHELAAPVTTH